VEVPNVIFDETCLAVRLGDFLKILFPVRVSFAQIGTVIVILYLGVYMIFFR